MKIFDKTITKTQMKPLYQTIFNDFLHNESNFVVKASKMTLYQNFIILQWGMASET